MFARAKRVRVVKGVAFAIVSCCRFRGQRFKLARSAGFKLYGAEVAPFRVLSAGQTC